MRIIIFVVIAALCSVAAQAKDYPEVTLEKLLSKSQLESLNVSKMTANQKETLRMALINSYTTGFDAGRDKGIEQAVAYQQKKSTPGRSIESQIDGEFEGFEGETIIKLMNGQIWQQSQYNYTYHYAFMPNVLIYPSNGLYKMKVDGVNDSIYVQRLK
jgi:hypothetical protein